MRVTEEVKNQRIEMLTKYVKAHPEPNQEKIINMCFFWDGENKTLGKYRKYYCPKTGQIFFDYNQAKTAFKKDEGTLPIYRPSSWRIGMPYIEYIEELDALEISQICYNNNKRPKDIVEVREARYTCQDYYYSPRRFFIFKEDINVYCVDRRKDEQQEITNKYDHFSASINMFEDNRECKFYNKRFGKLFNSLLIDLTNHAPGNKYGLDEIKKFIPNAAYSPESTKDYKDWYFKNITTRKIAERTVTENKAFVNRYKDVELPELDLENFKDYNATIVKNLGTWGGKILDFTYGNKVYIEQIENLYVLRTLKLFLNEDYTAEVVDALASKGTHISTTAYNETYTIKLEELLKLGKDIITISEEDTRIFFNTENNSVQVLNRPYRSTEYSPIINYSNLGSVELNSYLNLNVLEQIPGLSEKENAVVKRWKNGNKNNLDLQIPIYSFKYKLYKELLNKDNFSDIIGITNYGYGEGYWSTSLRKIKDITGIDVTKTPKPGK